MTDLVKCRGCETMVDPGTSNRKRVWCSERCRKLTLYSRKCPDCGKTINTDGSVTRVSERCVQCNAEHVKAMTRIYIMESFREWHEMFGVPPTAIDWHMAMARNIMDRAPNYARKVINRHESTGRSWPSATTVISHFGSWSAGLRAAGFEPISQKDSWMGYRGRKARDEDLAA